MATGSPLEVTRYRVSCSCGWSGLWTNKTVAEQYATGHQAHEIAAGPRTDDSIATGTPMRHHVTILAES